MDKLTVIQRALLATGNGASVTLGDGSDEMKSAETAISRAIDYLIAMHNWGFAKKTSVPARLGDADFPPWLHRMQFPPDCWHLISLVDSVTGCLVEHRVFNTGLLTLADTNLKCVYVAPPASTATWHPLATEVLTLLVEAELYQGLNDDMAAAEASRSRAEVMLSRAASRTQQQDTAGNMYRSTVYAARRTRRG